MNLRDFLAGEIGKKVDSKDVPELLDQLVQDQLVQENGKSKIENIIKQLSEEYAVRPEKIRKEEINLKIKGKYCVLKKHDVEFLMLGLAYHIMRKQDSVRLKKKILMRNSSKVESRNPEEESKYAAKSEQLLIGEA
jgi:hypothetical protein